jgi:3-hydroxybutyryl-CoA dehydrogenase
MPLDEVRTIAVVGAGQMGVGIAQVSAQRGYAVRLVDTTQERALAAHRALGGTLEKLVAKAKLSRADADSVLTRIHPCAQDEGVAAADFVIEAASENFELKADLFTRLDAQAPPHAVLASNTSSISLTRLAARTKRPDRVVGMHFMNPVPLMKLVELVRALQTSDETHALTAALAENLGKTVIVSQDRPGFIVNRMLIPFLNEACFALDEGLGTASDIDAGARLGLNHPLGPLELADLIGLDTVLAIAEVLHRDFGDDKYRPAALLRNYVAAGWLGRKTGRGFYAYDASGAKHAAGRN